MLIGNRQVSFCFRWLNLLVTVLLTMPAMSLAAQTLEIKLVDGRNGHPMVGTSAYVNVWVGRDRKEAIAIPADDNGVARLQTHVESERGKHLHLSISTSSRNIPL